jgi:ligand-binding sensor domain-containing protein
MKQSINTCVLGLTLIGLLTNCTSPYSSQSSSCIPANVITNYSPNLKRQDETTAPHRKPMPSWWKAQLSQIQVKNIRQASVFDVVARFDHEIWLASYADALGNSIIRYRTDTGDIKAYGVLDQNGKGYVAGNLFVAHDGNLWARFITKQGYSILAQYEPQKDEFRIITDQDGLLIPPKEIKIIWNGRTQPVLNETPDGNLVIALNGVIYIYDPRTNQAKQILGRDKGLDVNSIAVSKDGHVWFTTSNELSIRELDPTNGNLWDYGPPPGVTADDPLDLFSLVSKAIEIDGAGRVWVSDFGWLEPSQETRYVWHPILRSTIFISIYDPEYEYLWIRPDAPFEFSDGNIWYESGIGIVHLNMQNSLWCWKATESGPLAEDTNGNLWLVAGGQIYKYEIHP